MASQGVSIDVDMSSMVNVVAGGGGSDVLKKILEGEITALRGEDTKGITKIMVDYALGNLTTSVAPRKIRSFSFPDVTEICSCSFKNTSADFVYLPKCGIVHTFAFEYATIDTIVLGTDLSDICRYPSGEMPDAGLQTSSTKIYVADQLVDKYISDSNWSSSIGDASNRFKPFSTLPDEYKALM